MDLVLYDGVCGLCDRTVQWLLKKDERGVLRFAPLQGPTAAAVRARQAKLTPDLSSIVFVENFDSPSERLSFESDAVIEILRKIGHRYYADLSIVPRPLRDWGYRFIARIRYRVFGRFDSCRLPSSETRARFLP